MENDRFIVSIVVPCYNEEENLEKLYFEVRKVLEAHSFDFELIFINDGSKDGTIKELLRLYGQDERVKIIDLSRNFGKEIALSAGLDYSSGDVTIPFDADLQDPPEIIVQLIEKHREGYDVVNAVRSARKGDSCAKRATAGLFYKFLKSLSNIEIPENVGDFRLLSRKALEALKKIPERRRFMKGLFAWIGFESASVFYERAPRFAGKTKWNYLKLVNLAIEGITSFSIKPLQISSWLGVFISFFSFFYAIYLVIRTLIHGNPVSGYPSTIVTILFLGGVQLIFLGIIGEYLGRVYEEVKARPLFLTKEVYDKTKKVEL